ncbi:D-alanyl-D-alanine carboxypeptidase family protein [Streptomyces desertarenae]|uniref:D-alanyl-D-alanine carboxypeptidase family protein n=1 Tax=Streptomyces desertarenae TaxID=2666184 RepID=A0ABW4PI96_9ACTN
MRSARGRLAATAVLFLPCLLATAPAAAAGAAEEKPGEPSPPALMSTVGGDRLGLPGTQIQPRAGAGVPELPASLTSRSWIVADAETGDVLAAKNAHWPLAPASTLKMLFADTLLPKFDPETVHRVTREELLEVGPGSSLVGVKEGLTYTVRDLWLGVFLRSGNDAVHVLAEMNGGKEETVREMNEHARELGALDTHVVSPDGYDAEGQVSSAYDLTLIARSGMQKPDFRAYAATVRATFPGDVEKGEDGERKRGTFEIQNTNRLLTGDVGLEPYEGIAGVKNGYTSQAGSTFTGVAQRGDRVLLVTAMHPEGNGVRVYQETAALLDWGFEAADDVVPVGQLVPPEGVRDGSGKNTDGRPAGQREDTAAAPSGHTAAGAHGPSGGADTALLVGAAALLALGAGAYGVHRRWPLPSLSGSPGAGRGRRAPAALGSPENPGTLERLLGSAAATKFVVVLRRTGASAEAPPAAAADGGGPGRGGPAADGKAPAAPGAPDGPATP